MTALLDVQGFIFDIEKPRRGLHISILAEFDNKVVLSHWRVVKEILGICYLENNTLRMRTKNFP